MNAPWRWLNAGGEDEGECARAGTVDAPVSKICFSEKGMGANIITTFKVTWANEKESATYGYTHGATKTVLELRYGEFFKRNETLLDNGGKDQVLQWLERNHQQGQAGQCRLRKSPCWPQCTAEVYSGLCVGFQAHLNQKKSVLNKGGIVLLNDIQHIVIKMKYIDLPNTDIQYVLVDDTTDKNDGETPIRVQWTKAIELTNKTSTLKTSVEELGITTTVLGTVFGISPEINTSYTATDEASNSTSYSKVTSTALSPSYQVPAGRKYSRTTMYSKGVFKVQFRPQCTSITNSGVTVQWPERPAQDVFGVASRNLHIRISNITNNPKGSPVDPPPYSEPVP